MTTEAPDTAADQRLAKLREAIATHPEAWEMMGDAWRLKRDHGGWDPWANAQLTGMVRLLAKVGGFGLCIIERTLEEDFSA